MYEQFGSQKWRLIQKGSYFVSKGDSQNTESLYVCSTFTKYIWFVEWFQVQLGSTFQKKHFVWQSDCHTICMLWYEFRRGVLNWFIAVIGQFNTSLPNNWSVHEKSTTGQVYSLGNTEFFRLENPGNKCENYNFLESLGMPAFSPKFKKEIYTNQIQIHETYQKSPASPVTWKPPLTTPQIIAKCTWCMHSFSSSSFDYEKM